MHDLGPYAWNRLSVDTNQSINQSINRTYNAHNCRKANRRRGDGSEPVAILSSRPTVGLLIEPGLQSRLERRNCSTFLQVPWKTVPDRRCSNAESSTLEIDPDAWQLKKALVRGSEHTLRLVRLQHGRQVHWRTRRPHSIRHDRHLENDSLPNR